MCGIDVDDDLAVDREHHAEDAVGRRVLRPDVDVDVDRLELVLEAVRSSMAMAYSAPPRPDVEAGAGRDVAGLRHVVAEAARPATPRAAPAGCPCAAGSGRACPPAAGAAQVRVAVEDDAEHVAALALVPVGGAPEVGRPMAMCGSSVGTLALIVTLWRCL